MQIAAAGDLLGIFPKWVLPPAFRYNRHLDECSIATLLPFDIPNSCKLLQRGTFWEFFPNGCSRLLSDTVYSYVWHVKTREAANFCYLSAEIGGRVGPFRGMGQHRWNFVRVLFD